MDDKITIIEGPPPVFEAVKMRSEVLENQDKFKQAAQNMEIEVAKLVSAARSGDFNVIQVQFGAVGKSCKECHEQFRSR